jgi:hypothetical protein
LAARLLRLTPAKLATLDPAALTEFGSLLETFAVGEMRLPSPASSNYAMHSGHASVPVSS